MSRNTKLLLGLLVLALVVGGGWWFAAGRKDDAPKFRTAKVELAPITATVSSTGTVNPYQCQERCNGAKDSMT